MQPDSQAGKQSGIEKNRWSEEKGHGRLNGGNRVENAHLPDAIADAVLFLFFCPWRVGAARRLEWRDYDLHEQALTLRPELNKTGYELQIPVDPQHTRS